LIQAGEIESPLHKVIPKKPKRLRIFRVVLVTEVKTMPDNFYILVENTALDGCAHDSENKASISVPIRENPTVVNRASVRKDANFLWSEQNFPLSYQAFDVRSTQ
jgi:hypothetical protein